jgi:hypothetical protein
MTNANPVLKPFPRGWAQLVELVAPREAGLGARRTMASAPFYDEETILKGFVEARTLAVISPQEGAAYEASLWEEEKLSRQAVQ